MNSALFIVIEGMDGVGKTTTIQQLAYNMNAKVLRHMDSHELETLEQLISDKAPSADIHNFALECLHKKSEEVNKLNQNDTPVIMDRYIYSAIAYYLANAKLIDEPIKAFNIDALQLRQPDVAFYLYLDSDSHLKRIQERGTQNDANDQKIISNNLYRDQLRQYFLKFTDEQHFKAVDIENKTVQEVCKEIEIQSLEIKPNEQHTNLAGLGKYYE